MGGSETHRNELARLEREYWNERFRKDGNPADLRGPYSSSDFFRDDWGLLAYVERILAGVAPGRILEVGTGLGSQAIPLALHHGFGAVVTDVAIEALRLNRRAAVEIRPEAPIDYTVADADRLPFADASFDVVLLHAALHHLARPRAAIEEMARCLRPDGLFVLGYEPNRRVFAPFRRLASRLRLTERYSRRFVADRYSVADDETPGFFADELRRWVEASDLAVEWLEPVWLVAAFAYELPALRHLVTGRYGRAPARLRDWSRRADRLLFSRLPAARRWCFAWTLGARKPATAVRASKPGR